MSIHSNFPRQTHEFSYSRLLEILIQLLSERVLKSFLMEPLDDKLFAKSLVSLYSRMSRLEAQKLNSAKLSSSIQNLSAYLSENFPDCCYPSSEAYSDNSQYSPLSFEAPLHTAKAYVNYPLTLEEIEEEDFKSSIKQDSKVRFHSQARRDREQSPLKSTFKHTVASTFSKASPDDIMSKYLKMSENFTEKKGAKEKSLFFNDGVFFHIP